MFLAKRLKLVAPALLVNKASEVRYLRHPSTENKCRYFIFHSVSTCFIVSHCIILAIEN